MPKRKAKKGKKSVPTRLPSMNCDASKKLPRVAERSGCTRKQSRPASNASPQARRRSRSAKM